MKRFAFLVHPRDLTDVSRYAPAAAGKREELISKVLEWMPPYSLSAITGVRSQSTGEEIVGEFICVPLLPRQLIGLDRQEVERRLVAAGRLAQERGAQIVGLGGYTAVVGESGRVLARAVDIPVTSGNCYTIAIALEGALAAARLLELEVPSCTAAVVGATGSIGAVCARQLARRVGRLILIGRSRSRLGRLAEQALFEGRADVSIETDVQAGVSQADLVVSATSSGGGLITADCLRAGALVLDVGVPHDVHPEVARTRPDVLVLDGGLVEAPGDPDFHFDFGWDPKLCLACMAETMTLTLEGRFESFSLGRGLACQDAVSIAQMASRHGFKLAGFRSFERHVSPEQLDMVRTQAQRARRGQRLLRW